MTWFVHAESRRIPLVAGLPIVVGRDSDADITIDVPRVSRRHVIVEINDAGSQWSFTDLSSNGTFGIEGRIRELTGSTLLVVALGAPSGPKVVISDDPDLNFSAVVAGFAGVNPEGLPEVDGPIRLREGVTRFGRSGDNDVVLSGVLASEHHAHFLRDDNLVEVVDLASDRGTYVNGQRISRASLSPHDQVSMGGSLFLVLPDGFLQAHVVSAGLAIDVENLTVTVGDVRLLHGVTFSVPTRSVLAVVGPSGSGKSTLMGAMTGIRPATRGRVLVGGRDLYSNYDELRYQIGLVPQADLVPAQLKVREALDFAAQLRLPRDVSEPERAGRIDEVLDALSLSSRADLRIDRLSGGQRKRVSVALEIMTRPSVLFLDEPTSGLDPGLDRQVMVLLREMADAGQTVVVVTHAVENISLADRLLVLAAGGYVAFCGPPSDAPGYFGVPDLPSVFLALETTSGTEWSRRWNEKQHLTSTDQDAQPEKVKPDAIVVTKPSGVWAQFLTLTRRNIKVIAADRAYAAFLVLLPLALAATGFLVGSSIGLAADKQTGVNFEARSILLVLVLGAVFTGAATSIQELVKERVIYQRERSVGLSRLSYISSKAFVLGVIAAAQGVVFALLTLIGRPVSADPLTMNGYVDIAVPVAAAAVASAMLGLLMSTFLPTREAALPALVIATMVQVVLSGAVPLRFSAVLDAVGWTLPGYWAFRAMAASVGLDTLLGQDPSEISWPHEFSNWGLSIVVLSVMVLLFVGFAVAASRRHDPGRRT